MAAFQDDGSLDESALSHIVSETELMQAAKRQDADERRHLLLRRSFQRIFVAEVIGWAGPIHQLKLEHALDQQPRCHDAPDLNLSFSSSGGMLLAAASMRCAVGIDIERQRVVAHALQIADRFFTDDETKYLSELSKSEQSNGFLHLWTAKEAGLKAIGKGIVSGMNTFSLAVSDDLKGYQFKNVPSVKGSWTLDYLGFCPGHLVAVVQSTCGE